MVDSKSTSSSTNAVSFKIVMLGDASVGKTCLVNRFIKGSFANTDATLAQDFKSKTMKVDKPEYKATVRL